MKLYFAGNLFSTNEETKKAGIKYKLYSYAYKGERELSKNWGKGLMLDSGAFSAFTQGKKIDINEYVKFLIDTKPDKAISLDVIGDERKSYENYLKIKEHYNVLPVIHYKTSKEYIYKTMESSNYICLGGLVPLSRRKNQLRAWLNYIFSIPATREKKIHLLGIMSKDILSEYPAYSADSTTAIGVFRYPQHTPIGRARQKSWDRLKLATIKVEEQLKQEQYLTNLWEKRGIIWQ